MLDAHAHLDRLSPARVAALLQEAALVGVRGAVLGGVDPEGWAAQAELVAAWPQLGRTLGLHPWAVAAMSDDALTQALADLDSALDHALAQTHVLALGECGLDRSSRVHPSSMPRQERALLAQLERANRRGLPLVLHVVRAHGRALELVEEAPLGGMVHGFSASPEVARRWLDRGLHLSFGGVLTRPEARRARAAAAMVPLDRLLVESDAPDQPPWGLDRDHHGPASVSGVIDTLATLRPESRDTLAQATAANLEALLGWSPAPWAPQG